MKKLAHLASTMVDKYLLFDNPLFQNSGTERPISDFPLKKSNSNNACSWWSVAAQNISSYLQNNEFNRVITSLNESYIISSQQNVSKDLLKTHQKVSKTPKSWKILQNRYHFSV